MKKILYLFLAVTIFACSSDDSSDTNEDNTTEKIQNKIKSSLKRTIGNLKKNIKNQNEEDYINILACSLKHKL